ncbi:hypothetical protein MIR68_000421 [Amoeboaphelidium protococcarum]|nr:hypothetical protein MIR68_000421 [Amoeboaphelidium protococcarum]
MVKSYAKYEQGDIKHLGVLCSPNADILFCGSNVKSAQGQFAFIPALDAVQVWSLKTGSVVAKFYSDEIKSLVTSMHRLSSDTSDTERLAVGYADGSIRVWKCPDVALLLSNQSAGRVTLQREPLLTLNGHKSAVYTFISNAECSMLFSGSSDTDIIQWDLIEEKGVCKFRGHKDQITSLHYITHGEQSYLISASKDTLIKVWDISSMFCVETVVGHRSEVWKSVLVCDNKYLISASSEPELRVWELDFDVLGKKLRRDLDQMQVDITSNDASAKDANIDGDSQGVVLYGIVKRQSNERVLTLMQHPSGQYFGCQTADRTLEIYSIKSDKDILKKLRKKAQDPEAEIEIKAEDKFVSSRVIKMMAKNQSFDFVPEESSSGQVLTFIVAMSNNQVQAYRIRSKQAELDNICSLDRLGHRSPVKTVALSSDEQMAFSAGSSGGKGDDFKLWNLQNGLCLRTLANDENYIATCSAFLAGNRHVVVGTKQGQLLLYDCPSSTLLSVTDAHNGAVTSLQITPDKRSLITGGADKSVGFWEFVTELSGDDDSADGQSVKQKILTVVQKRVLKLQDEVQCVRVSPNGNLVAIALLDNTIKVFFNDTLKLFLNLYGHKLPVLYMDISADSKMLISGSADKNIKIWGLDFGDCHKSIFAHQEAVTGVKFIKDTHLFVSTGRDKRVKYWDGDRFQLISKIDESFGELLALDVGQSGDTIIASGQDKCLRVYKMTDEDVFIEEEREREAEQSFEEEILGNLNEKDELDVAGQDKVGKVTSESLKAGEKIVEALQILEEELGKAAAFNKAQLQGNPIPPPQVNSLLIALRIQKPEQYVLKCIEDIKSADLDDALWMVSFSKIPMLLHCIQIWSQSPATTTLSVRVLKFVLYAHGNQIANNRSLYQIGDQYVSIKQLLSQIRVYLQKSLAFYRDEVGMNLAAMKITKTQYDQSHSVDYRMYQDEVDSAAALKSKGKTIMKRTLIS